MSALVGGCLCGCAKNQPMTGCSDHCLEPKQEDREHGHPAPTCSRSLTFTVSTALLRDFMRRAHQDGVMHEEEPTPKERHSLLAFQTTCLSQVPQVYTLASPSFSVPAPDTSLGLPFCTLTNLEVSRVDVWEQSEQWPFSG